jgi:MazG family protein
VIEEAYEVVEAIDSGRPDSLREELGDLLLQVVFQAQIMEEEGVFDAADVCRGLVDKLVARHPHVFGDVENNGSTGDVLKRWEGFKKKAGRGLLDGVPTNLPALLMAMRISDKAGNVGFEWPEPVGALEKLEEEIAELREAFESGDDARIEDELGDVLFAASNLARMKKINPEDALRRCLERFKARFKSMETALAAEGKGISDAPMKKLDELWELAKLQEKAAVPGTGI